MKSNFIWTVLSTLVVTGCDNVNWGGVELAIVPPPQVSAAPATSGEEVEERLPAGPVLYYVANTGGVATMYPVGEISGDSLIPIQARADVRAFSQRYIGEHLRQGAEFVLYRRGSRVGTFVVQSATAPEANVCPALPSAVGALELSSGAEQISEYLAIAEQYAPEIRRRAGAALETGRNMQVLAPILAEKMIRARRAPLPGNWQRAMEQLLPIPISGTSDPGYATTFLVGDTLGRGADNEGYSLFYIGVPAQFSYDTVFVLYNNYAEAGKAAPRVVDFLDWNRDDQPEMLLQVYGINDAWFETVGRTQAGQWRRTFRARCEQGTSAMPDIPTSADTMPGDTAR
ncbi:MAG: hypothetical protein WEE89_22175 [Gemmatimonadota bacterium]